MKKFDISQKTHFCRDFAYRSVGYKHIFLSNSVRFTLTALTTICLFNPFHTLPVLFQWVFNKYVRMNLVETKLVPILKFIFNVIFLDLQYVYGVLLC